MTHTLTTTPQRIEAPRTNVSRDVLIRAKRRRIAALEQGGSSPATLERERAELARLEAQS